MSTKPQIELFLENENGSQQVTYPFVEADHVSLSNGMDIDTMIRQDVSMPTVTHEDLSFKVGVGDQNVSSAIVDSSVAEMTIKGQTYQNILPEPSTHVLSSNKEMFKVNEGLDPNVEIVDGVSKSAILSGQTLVNVDSYYNNNSQDFQSSNIDSVSEDGYIQLTANGTWRNAFTKYNGMLKPSTKYLIVVDIKTNTLTGGNQPFRLLTDGTNSEGIHNAAFEGQALIINHGQTGIVKHIATTKADFSNTVVNLRNYVSNSVTSGVIVYRTMVLEYVEGMENWDIPFFRGMTSCKMPVLKSIGKNLYDPNNGRPKNLNFFYNNEQKNELVSHSTMLSCSVPITKGKKYSLSFSGSVPLKIHKSGQFEQVKSGCTGKVSHHYTEQTITAQMNGYWVIMFCYTEDGVTDNWTQVARDWENELNLMIVEDDTPSSYEPFKSNILSTPEEVVLREVNGVKDTLNLNTGEYIQRIGEKVFDGSQTIALGGADYNTVVQFYHGDTTVAKTNDGSIIKVLCNNFPVYAPNDVIGKEVEGVTSRRGDNQGFYFSISKTKIASRDTVLINNYLQQNPITIQYELATPIIKTVDLSSSGNWEKIVLDGSEPWRYDTQGTPFMHVLSYLPQYIGATSDNKCFTEKLQGTNVYTTNSNIGVCVLKDTGTLRIRTQEISNGQSLEEFKKELSQNPVTVWYQTVTHQDSTQVKQPIFFKDGHIIQSSGADNSLIPTLDYQAKTRNSYVMDLMKTNTRYTMKAKSASGTFTIDGTSYGAGTNGTFTTPSSMTNKFLVMSNKTNEEVMILEGDVVSKTIPYFKGIKSAFEDEGKIEVLSTGKNLYPHGDSAFTPERDGWYFINGDRETLFGDKVHKDCGQGAWFYLEGGRYYFNVVGNDNVKTLQVVGEKERLYGSGATIPKGWYALRMRVQNANQEVSITNVMVEKDTETNYEPYKSNSTKIPLLSSLQTVVENVHMTQGSLDNTTGAELVDTTCVKSNFIEVVEDTTISFRNNGLERMAHILAYDSEKRYIEKLGIISSCSIPKNKGIKYVRIFMTMSDYEKLTISKSVKAYKGLASLPNGVHDEIVLDRENNKAKIIQRVGKATVVVPQVSEWYIDNNGVTNVSRIRLKINSLGAKKGQKQMISNLVPATGRGFSFDEETTYIDTAQNYWLWLHVSNNRLPAPTIEGFKSWLSQNPLVTYYELETPIITEVDLEGFPYVYKDGHIFLNGEITPVTEIKYSINQQHQIESSSQDLIRHQKEIDYLYKLIGEYVRVDYKNTLLSLNLELK